MHGEARDTIDPVASRMEKEAELNHLLHCGLVREGTQIHALLAYLGAKALDACEPVKEYTIGVEALGKPPGHDPRIDPTVRVDIAKLRKRLKDYYQGDGASRPIHLEIPHGSYLPVYSSPRRSAPVAARMASRMLAGTLTALAIVLILVLAFLLWRNRTLAPPPALAEFWAPHLQGRVPTLLVCGTPMFVKVEGGYYRDTNTNRPDEIPDSKRVRKVADALQPKEIRPVFTFIGRGEAQGVFEISRLLAPHQARLILRQSHEVTWGDFKNQHVILLGGRKYNSQIPELPYKAAFEAERRKIRNLQPASGEPAEYLTASATPYGEITEEYCLISVYPGLTPGTRLLTLDSSSTEGTLAAAEFLTREDLVSQFVARQLPLRPSGGKYPAFQAIIRARFNHGVPVDFTCVNHRVISIAGDGTTTGQPPGPRRP